MKEAIEALAPAPERRQEGYENQDRIDRAIRDTILVVEPKHGAPDDDIVAAYHSHV